MVNIPMSEQEVPPRIRDIISRIGVSYPDIDYVEKYKYDDRLRGVLYFEPKFDGSNIRLIAREGYLIISSRRKLVATPQFIRGFIEAINNSYNPAVADITIDSLYEWMEKNEFIVFAELFGYKNTPMRIHKDWMYEWDLRIFDVFSVSEKRFVEPDKWRSGPISNISVEFVTGEPRSFDELVALAKKFSKHEGVVIKNYEAQFFAKWKPELEKYPPDQLPNSEILGAINKAHIELGENFFNPKKAMPLIAKLVRIEVKKHGKKKPHPDRVWRLYLSYRNDISQKQ
ncbi:MAG: RNA ligase family protein [Candidatus Njordarchaeota archaeon]